MSEPTQGSGDAPAAAGSPLEIIRELQASREALQTFDVAVPHYPRVRVRCGLIDHARAVELFRKFMAGSDVEERLHAASALLAEACVGVWAEGEDGEELGLDPDRPDEWPTFDRRLAEILGRTADTPLDAQRALLGRDADIENLASDAFQQMGLLRSRSQQDVLGNSKRRS